MSYAKHGLGFRLIKPMALALVAAMALVVSSSNAHAGDKAQCQIFEIKAKKGKGPLDARLKPVANKLKRSPFNAWGTFTVVSAKKAKAERMKAVVVKLVQGAKLSMLLRDLSESKGKKPRLRLTFNLDNKGGKRVADVTVNVDSGDFALMASGLKYPDGELIIATSCTAQ